MVFNMKAYLRYKPDVICFSSVLKFPEKDVFQTLGLLDIILKMTGSLKYTPGIFNFSFQFKFR